MGVQTEAGEAVMVNALQDDSQWPCVNFAKPSIDATCNDESRVLSVSRYSLCDFCFAKQRTFVTTCLFATGTFKENGEEDEGE